MAESKQYYYVYKLFNPDCSEFYIGSTTNIEKRMYMHKFKCNNVHSRGYHYKVYEYIRSNGGYDSWRFEILEHILNSINIKELHGIERKYIEQLKPSLNVQKPNRTKAQWHQDNRESLLSNKAQYYQDNKESINTKQKQKFECACGGKYTTSHKARHMKSNKHKSFIQYS